MSDLIIINDEERATRVASLLSQLSLEPPETPATKPIATRVPVTPQLPKQPHPPHPRRPCIVARVLDTLDWTDRTSDGLPWRAALAQYTAALAGCVVYREDASTLRSSKVRLRVVGTAYDCQVARLAYGLARDQFVVEAAEGCSRSLWRESWLIEHYPHGRELAEYAVPIAMRHTGDAKNQPPIAERLEVARAWLATHGVPELSVLEPSAAIAVAEPANVINLAEWARKKGR